MAFFDLPSSRSNSKRDRDLLKKAATKKKSTTAVTLKGNGNLLDRIQAIISVVKQKFEGKEDELLLITEEKPLIEYIDKCIENGVISIDTETTGLDPILDRLVGICIYTPDMKAAYIPVNHVSYVTRVKCENQLPIDFLKEQFQRLIDNDVKTIWFNAPFDIRFLGNHLGVWFTAYFDTSVAARMLNTEETSKYELKPLHKKYCWGDRGEALTFGKLFDNIPFDLIPITTAYLYAASDAIYTYELYEFQAQFLEPDGKYYEKYKGVSYSFFNIEMKSMPTFISMEQTGFEMDYEYVSTLSEKYHVLSDKMAQNLKEVCDRYMDEIEDYKRNHPECKLTDPINFGSPTQLAIVLYDILKLKSPDPKKPRGTGKDILKQIDHPLCKEVLANRAFEKAISTYIDKLPEVSSQYPDRRIHCKLNQVGARCVVGETSILTKDGSFPIASLFSNDDVSGEFYETDIDVVNRNLEIEKASHRVMYKDVDTIKITLRGGYQIEGTPNHPIICSHLTRSDINRNKSDRQIERLPQQCDFKELKDIKIGDIVQIPFGYNIFPTEYIDIGHLGIGLDNLNEDFAEFLGMYHADGYYKEGNGSFTVVLCNNSEDVIERFSYLCKKLFNVHCRTYKSSRNGLLNCFSKKKLESLKYYLKKGARFKTMPIDVMKSPKSVVCAYIRGMTLDSTVSFDRQRLAMTCVDVVTFNFIQQFLLNIGILSSCSFDKYLRRNDHSGVVRDEQPSQRLLVSGEMYKKFLDEIGFIESEKMLSLNESEYKKNLYLKYKNCYYAYVTKIEKSHNDVYDLTIPGTHSFISNGIMSHNTGRVSSKSPNLQNIPSRPFVLNDGTKIDAGHDIRQMFKATPGYILMSCDYSGQEVRVTAHLSNDRKMIQAYIDGKDVYSEIAAIAFNKTYEECCEKWPDGTDNPDGKARRGESKKIVLGRHIIAPVYSDICRKVSERYYSAVCYKM